MCTHAPPTTTTPLTPTHTDRSREGRGAQEPLRVQHHAPGPRRGHGLGLDRRRRGHGRARLALLGQQRGERGGRCWRRCCRRRGRGGDRRGAGGWALRRLLLHAGAYCGRATSHLGACPPASAFFPLAKNTDALTSCHPSHPPVHCHKTPQSPQGQPVKYEDQCSLRFSPNDAGGWNINGSGHNKFGSYQVSQPASQPAGARGDGLID